MFWRIVLKQILIKIKREILPAKLTIEIIENQQRRIFKTVQSVLNLKIKKIKFWEIFLIKFKFLNQIIKLIILTKTDLIFIKKILNKSKLILKQTRIVNNNNNNLINITKNKENENYKKIKIIVFVISLQILVLFKETLKFIRKIILSLPKENLLKKLLFKRE